LLTLRRSCLVFLNSRNLALIEHLIFRIFSINRALMANLVSSTTTDSFKNLPHNHQNRPNVGDITQHLVQPRSYNPQEQRAVPQMQNAMIIGPGQNAQKDFSINETPSLYTTVIRPTETGIVRLPRNNYHDIGQLFKHHGANGLITRPCPVGYVKWHRDCQEQRNNHVNLLAQKARLIEKIRNIRCSIRARFLELRNTRQDLRRVNKQLKQSKANSANTETGRLEVQWGRKMHLYAKKNNHFHKYVKSGLKKAKKYKHHSKKSGKKNHHGKTHLKFVKNKNGIKKSSGKLQSKVHVTHKNASKKGGKKSSGKKVHVTHKSHTKNGKVSSNAHAHSKNKNGGKKSSGKLQSKGHATPKKSGKKETGKVTKKGKTNTANTKSKVHKKHRSITNQELSRWIFLIWVR